ncbi:hypothetical protein AB9K26_11075 [Psychroserpens sp. XS_ASV72]|uniref:hypothetical protein n=1 Tax=Psychroserpens sp. XS_ASV72 TaxID=3241293 RepID=UPI0035150165
MNNLFSIVLSSLLLIQSFNISFNDIVQLDELIEHAQYHKAKYGDNFFVFISKHYGELKNDHNDHKEKGHDHQELPFQNCDHIVPISLFVIENQALETVAFQIIESRNTSYIYLDPFSTLHKEGLLQPPKHV